MGCLYRLTFLDGKAYIGVTKHNMDHRFVQHVKAAFKQRAGSALSAAIRNAITESIKVETLAIGQAGSYLKDLEIRAIEAFGTFVPNGLNQTAGGDGVYDPTGECETRRVAKIKASKATESYRELQRKVQAEYWQPDKRAARAEAIRKMWLNPAYREKMMRAPQRSKEGMDRARKALWDDPEKKKHALESIRGKSAQKSEAMKRNWALRKAAKNADT